jgi:hypothetical protein
VFFSLIPINFILKIQVPMREKIVLCILMGLGIVASIASIMKAVNSTMLLHSEDQTWDSVPLVIWSFVEEHLAIIAASIPCLKALFERVLRRVGITITYKSQAHRSYNMSTRNRNTKQTTVEDGSDVSAQRESIVPGAVRYDYGNDSHLGYDSEGGVEVNVYAEKR